MSDSEFTKQDFKLYLGVIIITLMVVISVIIATAAWNVLTMERNSAIGVLDANGGTGNYIEEMQVNDYYNATLEVGNFNSQTMLYKIEIKAGNITTITNSSIPAYINCTYVRSYQCCLSFYQTIRINVQCNLTVVQNDTKLIFELWEFNSPNQAFQYSGQWTHLWVNVTA